MNDAPPPSSRPSRLTAWLRAAGVLLAAGALAITFRTVDLGDVRGRVASLGWAALLVPLPSLVSLMIDTLTWRSVFSALGLPVRARVLYGIRLGTEAAMLTLPVGVAWCESLKLYLLTRWCGATTPLAIAGAAVHRYLFIASQCLFVAAMVLGAWSQLHTHSAAIVGVNGLLPWLGLGAAAALATLATSAKLALHRGALAQRLLQGLSRVPWAPLQRALERRTAAFSSTDAHLARYFDQPFAARVRRIAGMAVAWTFESVETFFILRLLGVELDFFTVASMEVLASLLRHTFFMVPAGLGVQDLGYATFLGGLGVSGGLEVAAAFSVLKRTKELFVASIGYTVVGVGRALRVPKPLPPAG